MMAAVDNLPSVISNLPDDCLVAIFQHLTCYTDREAFGLTCRRWLQIQNAARVLLKIRPFHGSNASRIYTKYVSRLLSRFNSLSSLSLAGCTLLSDSALKHLQLSGTKLQNLSLYSCFGLTDEGISFVSTGCPNLLSISLYRCNISDAALYNLSHSCGALRTINLSFCELVTDDGISALSKGCRDLKAVNISYCQGIKGHGFKGCSRLDYLEADSCSLTADGIFRAVEGSRLEFLTLSYLRHWMWGDGLGCVGVGGACLRFLNLRMCRFVGNESVTAIAKGCPVLKEWSLAVCHDVKILGWEAIAMNCKKLEVLHVNRCRNLCNQGLEALRNGCPSLRVLYMHACWQVTDVVLESFKLVRGDVKLKAEELVCFGPGLENLPFQ